MTAISQPARRLDWHRPLIYALLLAAAVFYLLPVYILLITGFKSQAEAQNMFNMWVPADIISLRAFQTAWSGSVDISGVEQGFMNSLQLVVPATLISSMIGSINGYILSKWKFRGADLLFPLILFGMFIPYQSILIPLVQTYQAFGRITGIQLYSTIPGLILAHCIYGIPITTLIFRNYYATIPTEMIEAARIDGANIFSIYRRILFPLSVPAFVVVLIWQFTSIWNDFLFGVIVTSRPSVQPITVALNNMAGSYIVEWNVQMAGALLAALPTLLVYIFLGRYFIRGLLAGSLKG